VLACQCSETCLNDPGVVKPMTYSLRRRGQAGSLAEPLQPCQPLAEPCHAAKKPRSGSPALTGLEAATAGAGPAHRDPALLESSASKLARAPSKFVPLCSLRPPILPLVLADGAPLESGASILIIQNPWLSLILDGVKTLEIRGTRCAKPSGERFYLALSGAGGLVFGSVEFVACHGPLPSSEWVRRAPEHCVSGAALPYRTTYAWEIRAPISFTRPVPYSHKPGCVIWACAD